ncbi:MAG TPA: HEAT repeat domain-containing protein, partial [Planctomycetota bacterium]|nr:HEAT repeat domain-containing protein [Planctomycetota bacterium]
MSTRSFRTDGSNSGWRLGAALLAAWVVAAPAGQAQASAGNPNAQPGKKMKPSVFSPPGSGTGGIYKPPNDAGAPPGGDGDGGEGGPGGGSGTAGKAASNGSRTEPAAAGASGGVTSRGGEALRGAASGAPAILLEDDQWNSWWEANKFDFIELRRIEDPMRTGQGLEPETPAQHELRLAANRLKVREQILPVLRSLTRSNDSAVRSAAIVALGKLHDESSIDLVRNSLADGSLDVRRASMLSLG